MNMQALLKQAQKMQKEIASKEEILKEKEYTASIGGVIKAVVKGDLSISNIDIDKSLLEQDNKEDIQEMLISVLNDALHQANEDKENTMNEITGGVKMPGGL